MEVIYEYVLVWGVVIFVTSCVFLWEKWQNGKKQQSTTIYTDQNMAEEHLTKDLFIEALKMKECQYKIDEELDTRIHFNYQGEHFFADVSNDSPFVHLYDTCWFEVELYKTDEVSRVRKAINTTNQSALVTTLFTINDDEKSMYVHSKYSFVFFKEMPGLGNYLDAILWSFFDAHRAIATEVSILREMEKSV